MRASLLDAERQLNKLREAVRNGQMDDSPAGERRRGSSAAVSAGTRKASAVIDTGSGSWNELRKSLREFTVGTQRKLEQERANLLRRCAAAEEVGVGIHSTTVTLRAKTTLP